MATKWEINRAVRASDLAPPSRLIMLTLSDMADKDTAVIPERYTPSLTQIADETGLSRSAVRGHLNRLEEAGWIMRKRPDEKAARYEHERTQYQLMVPDPEGARAGGAPASSTRLGQEVPQARAGDALGLGQEVPQARAGGALLYKEDDPDDLFKHTKAASQPGMCAAQPPAPPIPSPRREDPPTKVELIHGWEGLLAVYPLKDDPDAARKEYFKVAPMVGVAVLQRAAIGYRDSPKRNPDRTMKLKNWLRDGSYKNTGHVDAPPVEAFARPGLAEFDPNADD